MPHSIFARRDHPITKLSIRAKTSLQKLSRRRKNDPDKLAIAARLRKDTTLTGKDIAQRLHLATSKPAHSNFHRFTKAAANRILPDLTSAIAAFGL